MIGKYAYFFVLIWLFTSPQLSGQVYLGEGQFVAFTSDAPLELIKAESTALRAAIQADKRTFAFRVKINSFNGFNGNLQQQHFNENYLESNEYPEAVFQGRIIENTVLSAAGTYTVRAKGTLTIHGVAQERIISGQIESDGESLRIHCKFTVPLADHQIDIPRIVHQKIASEILVEVEAELRQK